MSDDINIPTKEFELNDSLYMFDTLEELVNMLKDDNYKCILTIRKKGKLKKTSVIL
jgi:hypothetical protein